MQFYSIQHSTPRLRRMRVRRMRVLMAKLLQFREVYRWLLGARFHVEHDWSGWDAGRSKAFSILSRLIEQLDEEGGKLLQECDTVEAMLDTEEKQRGFQEIC
jgi:hypothetical protein